MANSGKWMPLSLVNPSSQMTKRKAPSAAPVNVPVSDFGKDHWSLLAYIESCAVDRGGDIRSKAGLSDASRKEPLLAELCKERLRCNEASHPIHAVNSSIFPWKPSNGTRLAGYFVDGGFDASRQLVSHDDWDCLNDLEFAGLIEVLSEANAVVRLSEAGIKAALSLREFKARGGKFADFRLSVAA